MKYKYTKEQLSAPCGEIIAKVPHKEYTKRSDYDRYRIVCITTGSNCAANREYKIEAIMEETYLFDLPKIVGGLGLFTPYYAWFWGSDDRTRYDTKHDAEQVIKKAHQDTIAWENKVKEKVTTEIVGWHPEED